MLVFSGAMLMGLAQTWSFDEWNSGAVAEFVGVACLYLGGGVGLASGPLCLFAWAFIGKRTRLGLEAFVVGVAALAIAVPTHVFLVMQGDDPLTDPVKEWALLPVPLAVPLTLFAVVAVTLAAIRSRGRREPS